MAEIPYTNKHGQVQEFVAVHLPVGLVDAIRVHAENTGVTMARVLREALAAHLPTVAVPERGEPNGGQ